MALGGSLAGVARVVLRVDDSQFHRDLSRDQQRFRVVTNDMNHDAERMGRGVLAGSGAFSSLGRNIAFASGTFLGAAGFTAVVRQSISAASDLNEQMNKVRVVFRDGAKDVIEFSKTTTTALGISQQEALATAGTFGNMLIPMGFARKESAGMSVNLVKLAADMASFNNADPSEVLEALRSGLAGEAEPLRRFGVQLSDARERAVLTEAGVKNLGGTLTAQQRTWAAYQLILKDTSDAQGDFSRTSGGLANQQRILHAQLQQTEAQIGKALLPVVLKITTATTDWLGKSENQERIQRDVNEAVEAATEVFHDLKTAVEQIDGVTGGFKQTMELLLALKVVSVLASWQTALVKLIGTEVAAGAAGSAGGAAGLAGAESLTARLLASWRALVKLGPAALVVTLAVEGEAVSDWLRKNIPGLKSIHDLTKGLPFNDFNPLDPPWEWGKSKSKPPMGGSRIPDYTAKPGGGAAYPLGSRGSIIGTPGAGTHSFTQGPNNWESDNAIDIAIKVGTPVLAVADGTIGQQIGPLDSNDPRMAGLRLHLIGDNGNEYYYAHLSVLYVKAGQRVKKGQTLGLSGSANGTAHLHFASKSGNPLHFANVDVPTQTGTGGAPPASAASTKKPKAAAVDLTAMPGGIALAFENAVGAGDAAAQIASLRKFIAILQQRKALAKTAASKADIQDEINQTRDKIAGIRKDGQSAADAAAAKLRDRGDTRTRNIVTGIGGISDTIQGAISSLTAGGTGTQNVIDMTGTVIGKTFAGQSAVRFDAKSGKWIVTKVKPDLDALKNELTHIRTKVLPTLSKRIKATQAAIRRLSRHPKKNQAQLQHQKQILAALQAERGEVVALASDLAQSIDEMAESLRLDPDPETADVGAAAAVGGGDSGPSPEDLARDAFNARADYLTEIPADIRLRQVLAQGTPDTADDAAVKNDLLNLTLSREAEAKADPSQIEALITLEQRLNELRGQEAQLISTTVDQFVSYLQARRDITRTYADTVFSRQFGGSQIVIQNTFANVPSDPHLYSQNLAFELQALT